MEILLFVELLVEHIPEMDKDILMHQRKELLLEVHILESLE